MSDKDKSQKLLEDYNDVFADIINTLVFQENFLNPMHLSPGPTESVYKAETSNLKDQRRDVLKLYYNNHFRLFSLGIENQATRDNHMPIRVMGYDYATYREMVANKKPVTPVITTVLNFTDKRWKVAKSIHQLLKLPKRLQCLVSDYKIQVFDIAFLEDEVIEQFTSDFKLVAKFFKAKRLGIPPKQFFASKETITHSDEFLELLAVFSGDSTYRDIIDIVNTNSTKGGKHKMCEYAQALVSEGKEQGIAQGKQQLILQLYNDGLLTPEKAAFYLNITVDDFLSLKRNPT